MPRYFTRPVASEHWTEDEVFVAPLIPSLQVADHTATDTGVLDVRGNAIMRYPREMGFGRDID